jgi:hypothetical protein
MLASSKSSGGTGIQYSTCGLPMTADKFGVVSGGAGQGQRSPRPTRPGGIRQLCSWISALGPASHVRPTAIVKDS